jgi:hypothetical protein
MKSMAGRVAVVNGAGRLDVLVNNTGTDPGPDARRRVRRRMARRHPRSSAEHPRQNWPVRVRDVPFHLDSPFARI